MWATIISTITKPITDLFIARTERKAAKDSIKGKLANNTLDSATQITLTDAEWEIVKAENEAGSWKDEYVTVIVTAPIPLIVTGALLATVSGDRSLLDGAVAGIEALTAAGIPMPQLMTATVYAALGLKLWRSK